MTAPAQFSIYDGRQFMGSWSQNADGECKARGQDYKPLGKFKTKRDAVAAIVRRYVPRECEARAAR